MDFQCKSCKRYTFLHENYLCIPCNMEERERIGKQTKLNEACIDEKA